jgi:cell division protein FtsN
VKAPEFLVTVGLVLLAGCAPSLPPIRESDPPPPRQEKPLVQPPAEFETKTDTLEVARNSAPPVPDTTATNADIWYAVQIGAYKDPQNASAAQALARERYQLPVINDFSQPTGLYQIRLGSFPTRETARDFLRNMQQAFPAEYRDSWIVQLKR